MTKIRCILIYIIVYTLYAFLWDIKHWYSDIFIIPIDRTDFPFPVIIFLFIIVLFMIYIFPKIFFTLIAQKFRNKIVRFIIILFPISKMIILALRHQKNGSPRNIFATRTVCGSPDTLPPLSERWLEFCAYDCVQILFYIIFALAYFHIADQNRKKNTKYAP